MYYRCLSSFVCATLLPSKETMINANYDYIYKNPKYPEAVKQQLGDYLQFIHEQDPEDVRIYKYFHDYATLSSTTVNVPTSSDLMWVMSGATKLYVEKGERVGNAPNYQPVPGFEATKQVNVMGAASAFTEEWNKLSDELVQEIDEMQTHFAISINLYDHVEDF